MAGIIEPDRREPCALQGVREIEVYAAWVDWNRSAQCCFIKMFNIALAQLAGVERGIFFLKQTWGECFIHMHDFGDFFLASP